MAFILQRGNMAEQIIDDVIHNSHINHFAERTNKKKTKRKFLNKMQHSITSFFIVISYLNSRAHKIERMEGEKKIRE